MKYSYTWLEELSKTRKSSKQLAELLTMRAFELDNMKTEGNETQLEFSILPNRAHDALSHLGMAREIRAIEGRKFSLRSNLGIVLRLDLRDELKVEIKDKKLCPRYIGVVIENIKVGPSPKWLQQRLLVCGIKPINNIVDVTNYTMLETGQPLHAFDFKKTTGNIVVRKARKGEKIKLLDEKEYKLTKDNLVIADSERPLALAGVMGGFDSSANKNTSVVILESANFNSTNIRKTRTYHNIITESSYRFEREIDPNLAETGMARAIELIKKHCGKDVKIVATTDVYPKKIKPWTIKLDTTYVNKLLGENIPIARMKKILENLGIRVKVAAKILNCEIPTVRIDLKSQEDLTEEIGRIYGYENIKEQVPLSQVKIPRFDRKKELEDKMRDIMAGLGFSEVMNYSFYGADDIAKCNLKVEEHLEVANPMNPEQQYLRKVLIPNLLKNVKLNLKKFDEVKIFEIGKKFCEKENKLIEASAMDGLLVCEKDNSFIELKGETRALLKRLGYENTKYKMLDTDHKFWHPTRTAYIFVKGEKIGKIGEINPLVLKKYGVRKRVAVFGLKIDKLLALAGRDRIFQPISKFPAVQRDISMFVPKNVGYADIHEGIKKAGGELVKNIELFDTFKDSLAIRLEIGSSEKTLTTAEIDAIMQKIIAKLEKELKLKVRK